MPDHARYDVSVLGPTAVDRDGVAVPLRPRERSLLAALALHHPAAAGADALVDDLWPAAPTPAARKAVHNHVARMRRAAGPGLVATGPDGYRLGPTVALDLDALLAALRDADAAGADPRRRVRALERAVRLDRGIPFADLPDGARAIAARARFQEILWAAEEDLAAARIDAGDAVRAANTLAGLVADQPARERRWSLLMLAQYRSGRRRDALATYQRARRSLAEEAGLEPGEDLRALEQRILDDDRAVLGLPTVAPPGPRPADPPAFVGRVAELTALRELLHAAAEGRPSLASIEGEAGIGKTTLARRFATEAAATRARVLWAACDAVPDVPLQPFARVLDELARAAGARFERWLPDDAAPLAALSPALAERLPAAPSTPDPGRHRLHDAVVAVLVAASAEQPLVVVLDDFHLAPPGTQRLAVACLVPGARILVVATRRVAAGDTFGVVERAPAGAVRRLPLGGLDADELAVLLDGSDVDATVSWLLDQTGGNPLLVRELCRPPSPGGRRLPSEAAEGLPEVVRRAVEERLTTVSAPTRSLLAAAAVLGPRFPLADLSAMSTGTEAALEEAERAGIVWRPHGGDEVEFTHELLWRVLYESLPEGTLVELHDLAASVIEQADGAGRRAGTVARHRLRAAAVDPAGALAAARDAAARSLAGYAYEEAAELYRAALEVARANRLLDARAECELVIGRGEALRRAGDPANVEVLLDAAARSDDLGDGDLLAAAALALCQLGPTTEAGGSDPRAAELAARALEGATDPRLRAEVAGAASLVHSMAGDHDRCRRFFEVAADEARRLGDDAVLARVLPYAYLALGGPDDLDRRATVAEEVALVARALGDPATEWEGEQLRFSVALQRADPALFDAYERLRDLTAFLREPTRVWAERYLAAAVAHLRGDLDAAEAAITETLAFEGVVSPSRVLAVYGAQLLGIRADQGRLHELAEPIADLAAQQPGVPAWHAAGALVAAEHGDAPRVRAAFDRLARRRFAPLDQDFVWTAALFALGRAVGRIGDAERSLAVLEVLGPYSGRMSWFGTGSYGPIDLALAEAAGACGDADRAARLARAADRTVSRLRRR